MEPERFCTRRRTPSNGAPGTSVSMSLDTPHLTLRLCAPEHLLTLIDQPERFEQVVGVPVADGLHGFYVSDDVSPDWLAALRSSSGPDPWRHGFFVVHREGGSVIGSAGFKGPPDSTGTVEIAYGIVPPFEGRGYATEAAAARPRVRRAASERPRSPLPSSAARRLRAPGRAGTLGVRGADQEVRSARRWPCRSRWPL